MSMIVHTYLKHHTRGNEGIRVVSIGCAWQEMGVAHQNRIPPPLAKHGWTSQQFTEM